MSYWFSAWVTQPESLKGAKDEVKRPEGPPTRSWGREGPETSNIYIWWTLTVFLVFRVTVVDLCN